MKKKEKILPQLLAYAGKRKVLTYLSMVIAGISQLLALAPFLYIWAILRDVIAGDYSRIAHWLFRQHRQRQGTQMGTGIHPIHGDLSGSPAS